MPRPHSQPDKSSETLIRRLDRGAGQLNAFLAVLAIGLAVLDATCFTALNLRNLPAYVGGSGSAASGSAPGSGATQ